MASSKNRRGPHSRKSEKRKRTNKSVKTHDEMQPTSQTDAPFEQDAKRRIGQHIGTGRAPLMKK